MLDFTPLQRLLYDGQTAQVEAWVQQALADGTAAATILQDGLIAGMQVVGEDFKNNVLYVPHVLVAARAMKAGMAVLEPHLKQAGGHAPRGTIVLGTVKGDLHDIGKNLVGIMAEGAGFQVIDIGVDRAAADFVAAAQDHGAGIVGLSALLTTTMPYMRTVVEALREAGLEQTRVCVGGAPLNQEFAAQIGAAGYAADAPAAVDLFRSLYPAAAPDR